MLVALLLQVHWPRLANGILEYVLLAAFHFLVENFFACGGLKLYVLMVGLPAQVGCAPRAAQADARVRVHSNLARAGRLQPHLQEQLRRVRVEADAPLAGCCLVPGDAVLRSLARGCLRPPTTTSSHW